MVSRRNNVSVPLDQEERALIEAEAARLDIAFSHLLKFVMLGAIRLGMSDRLVRAGANDRAIRRRTRATGSGKTAWRNIGQQCWVATCHEPWMLIKPVGTGKTRRVNGFDITDRKNWWVLTNGTRKLPMAFDLRDAQRMASDWLAVNS